MVYFVLVHIFYKRTINLKKIHALNPARSDSIQAQLLRRTGAAVDRRCLRFRPGQRARRFARVSTIGPEATISGPKTAPKLDPFPQRQNESRIAAPIPGADNALGDEQIQRLRPASLMVGVHVPKSGNQELSISADTYGSLGNSNFLDR